MTSDPTTETGTPRRHGRRARALTPEEQARRDELLAAEKDAAAEPGTATETISLRGVVAPPTSDTPLPTVRRSGRRARVIEIDEEPRPEDRHAAETVVTGEPEAEHHAAGADTSAGPHSDAATTGAPEASAPTVSPTVSAEPVTAVSTATATAEPPVQIARDEDGVELGELSGSEAPSPKPSPRFDGRVLHRPESAGGRSMLWIVWALVALAVLALIVLLLTGVLGGSQTSAEALAQAILTPMIEEVPTQ
ncbi:hypothetical protein JSY14_01845 [Brachybacterium sp. EF45031]|uniref:hypothetical protein n=1 Tax=Brachybacterium sillae TaxID=2810536 RepID=UPI00217E9726|nr:hypothetical protein [Brachybacterium sillae]MCS6710823.1 hypothetical protein [Brachybacterium sillae]